MDNLHQVNVLHCLCHILLTHSPSHDIEQATDIVKTVLDLGINHFDVAESHSGKDGETLGWARQVMIRGHVYSGAGDLHLNIGGQGEIDLGLALRNQKGLRRSDFVISTKVFWGGKGPNDRGLSRKHVFEGTVACLQRLQLDYVDVLYAQRPGICVDDLIYVTTDVSLYNRSRYSYGRSCPGVQLVH